jgi:predicted transcriptional regulator
VRKCGISRIIAQILRSANGGIGKMTLLTTANLTSAELKRYMDLLLENR